MEDCCTWKENGVRNEGDWQLYLKEDVVEDVVENDGRAALFIVSS